MANKREVDRQVASRIYDAQTCTSIEEEMRCIVRQLLDAQIEIRKLKRVILRRSNVK